MILNIAVFIFLSFNIKYLLLILYYIFKPELYKLNIYYNFRDLDEFDEHLKFKC